jgi:hypothetical protein
MLAAPSVPPHLVPASLANSATFHIGIWLALPAVPFVVSFLCICDTLIDVVSVFFCVNVSQ